MRKTKRKRAGYFSMEDQSGASFFLESFLCLSNPRASSRSSLSSFLDVFADEKTEKNPILLRVCLNLEKWNRWLVFISPVWLLKVGDADAGSRDLSGLLCRLLGSGLVSSGSRSSSELPRRSSWSADVSRIFNYEWKFVHIKVGSCKWDTEV